MVNFLVHKLPEYFQPITIRKKRIISFLLAFILTLISYQVILELITVEIPIFGFHDIVDIQNPQEIPPQRQDFPGDYSQQKLEPFLESLVANNYWFLSTQELYDYFLASPQKIVPAEYRDRQKVIITFDDGNKSIYTHLLPILEKLENKYGTKNKAVVFINSGFFNTDNSLIKKVNCQELRDGFQKGFYDIQSHGFTHKNLTELNGQDLELEISKSKLALRKCMGDLDKNKIIGAHIAYPYGASDSEVEKILPKYHLTGFLYNDRFLRVQRLRNNYRISRITTDRNTSPRDLIRVAQKASTFRQKNWF